MSASHIDQLLVAFEKNPRADESSLTQFERETGIVLPTEYADFLRRFNGGEGFIGIEYARFWRIEDLIQMNMNYEVAEYTPGLLLFGTNGGREAFAFDMRTAATAIVVVPFIGMELSEALPVAVTFDDFLLALFEGRLFQDVEH